MWVMQPGFDDELQRLIHDQAYAAHQLMGEMDSMAHALGRFRAVLINHGFSAEGAERIAREFFVVATDQLALPLDGEDLNG